jgi:hypothetical protein
MIRMRKFLYMIPIVMTVMVIGCSSVKDAFSRVTGDALPEMPATEVQGDIDFRAGEVLCAVKDVELLENDFLLAKVVTPASSETKNQSEVIFLKDGEKKWVYAVVPSHKASNDEISLGTIVLYSSYAREEKLYDEYYRKSHWYMGRVSSLDELFKGIIEVNGDKKNMKWIRIPEIEVE